MKKLHLAALALAPMAAFALAGNASAASAAPTCGSPAFYANGTPVVINSDSAGGTIITWTENGGGSCPYTSAQVGSLRVLGGYVGDTESTTASITMNSGTVFAIFGGGMNDSHVTTSSVVINGGTILESVSGGGYATGAYSNVVEDVTVTINGASNTISGYYPLIQGGGTGNYAQVDKTTVNVKAGDWTFVTAAGSSGTVGEAILNITGGNIGVVQGVNRGSADDVEINITGGTIDNVYAGVEPGEGNANTSVTNGVSVSISGTADVQNVGIGETAPGTPLSNSIADLAYVTDNLANSAGLSQFSASRTTQNVNVTIDGTPFVLAIGGKLSDLDLTAVKTKADHTFKGFKDAGGNAFSEDSSINVSIVLTAVFEANPANPLTADNLAIVAILGVLGLLGFGASRFLFRK